jgi:2,4'-dihydroxyacetophenone dioxygenase
MTTFPLSPALDALPWQPITPGFSLKLVRGGTSDDDTRVLLLRLEPGTVIAPHRHSGEIHAFNLAGTRKLLDTGEIIGPGAYVFEPPGNHDSWMAVGDEPVIVFLTARGAMEYLDEHGMVTARSTTTSVTADYQRFVANASHA